MKRIKSFGVFQTAKFFAILYFLFSAVILLPLVFLFSLSGASNELFPFAEGMTLIMLPVFYGIMGFIFTAIGCLLYNVVAKWTGGIEIEIESDDDRHRDGFHNILDR